MELTQLEVVRLIIQVEEAILKRKNKLLGGETLALLDQCTGLDIPVKAILAEAIKTARQV
ncbi:MAG: hypothetical protein JW883_12410 [Deltaproteobacteria bacterium]|nr:hypothetical protein [Deltaproteobacteria bacterium]